MVNYYNEAGWYEQTRCDTGAQDIMKITEEQLSSIELSPIGSTCAEVDMITPSTMEYEQPTKVQHPANQFRAPYIAR